MNLSLQWVKDFVAVDATPHDFAAAMSLSGSKVEGYLCQKDAIHNVVVGFIESVEPHPDADRLKVCKVSVGKGKTLTIVTGAPNVAQGCYVPVALDGARLPDGKEIQTGMLRGILSEGMMCSVKELGLTLDDVPYGAEAGLLLLQETCDVGQDICDVLLQNDTVVEFEITPNRPDCLSVRGLAREISATFDTPLTLPTPTVKGGGGHINEMLKITIESPELCPRYTARMVKDVKIEPSPKWLRARLRASGVRPINNIVDITNYVMLEYGQPMHAFDYSCLTNGQIVVRTAAEGETLYTLDGQERKLTPNMLLIADAQKAVGVAGVMGGANSEITDKTTCIVLESATFNGPSIRKTALQLAMRTDASGRFEKGLDAENTIPAIERACELIEMLSAGIVLDGLLDVNITKPEQVRIPLEPDRINALLGTDISEEMMIRYLTSLSFVVEGSVVSVPSFRSDVRCMEDLAEEVARLFGYNNIAFSLSSGGALVGALSPAQLQKRVLGRCLRSQGYDEMLSYSFVSPADFDQISLPKDSELRNCVTILNPLGEDKSIMRTTMLPSLLMMLAGNAAVRNADARLYEIGIVFHPTNDKLPTEKTMIVLGSNGQGNDFYTLKGSIETICGLFHIESVRFVANTDGTTFHPGRCAQIFVGETLVGIMGEIHPQVLENYGLESRAWAAELNFDMLFALKGAESRYKPLPRFPAIRRDIALVCNKDIPSAAILDTVATSGCQLLESCELFDVYTGNQVPDGRKSMAYKLVFRHTDRTLTDAEVDAELQHIMAQLRQNHEAVLR